MSRGVRQTQRPPHRARGGLTGKRWVRDAQEKRCLCGRRRG